LGLGWHLNSARAVAAVIDVSYSENGGPLSLACGHGNQNQPSLDDLYERWYNSLSLQRQQAATTASTIFLAATTAAATIAATVASEAAVIMTSAISGKVNGWRQRWQ
jgi:hypothetical protein